MLDGRGDPEILWIRLKSSAVEDTLTPEFAVRIDQQGCFLSALYCWCEYQVLHGGGSFSHVLSCEFYDY